MRPSLKDRLLRLWKKLVRFAQWCEDHGIPKMLVEMLLKIILWWLTK